MKTAIFILSTITVIGCQQKPETENAETTEKNNSNPAVENKSKAYILHKDEGEILNDDRGRTNIIKVSPETGAAHLTMGIQQMPKGTGIRLHQHDKTEEILFVHKGNGIAIINGDTVYIQESSTLFIPPGTWHGIKNPNDSMSILFVVTPQGLEKLFRGIGSPPGVPLKKWTDQQMDSIERVSDSKAKKNQ